MSLRAWQTPSSSFLITTRPIIYVLLRLPMKRKKALRQKTRWHKSCSTRGWLLWGDDQSAKIRYGECVYESWNECSIRNKQKYRRFDQRGRQACLYRFHNGHLLTGRDAAHARLAAMLRDGKPLPVSFTNRIIYYVGPVDPVGDEVVGPAGLTTATRMDKFTELMLRETGLLAMIGKAERGAGAIEAIR